MLSVHVYFFKSSLLTNIGKAHPGNHPLLFLCIVGGVTYSEVKHIRETIVTSRSNKQVLIS